MGNDPRVQQIIAMIEQDLAYSWQVEELAAFVLLSPRQLTRIFQEGTGSSPLQFLHRSRLARAAELLGQTYQHIHQIAQHVGISDTRYFRRSFREHYGVSPLDYRRSRMLEKVQKNESHVALDPQMSL